jgi:hypothetical protein
MEAFHCELKELQNKRKEIDKSIIDCRKNALKTWLGPLYSEIKLIYLSDIWGRYHFQVRSTGELLIMKISYGVIISINNTYAPEDGWKDLRRVKVFRELSKEAQQFVLLVFNQLKIDHIETIELIKLIE